MSGDETTSAHSERNRSGLVRRLLKPMVMLSPLTAAILVGAIFYGSHSNRVAGEIDDTMTAAVQITNEGVRLASSSLCPDADPELQTLVVAELAMNDPSRKASLSGLGFSSGIVDFKGWLEPPDQAGGSSRLITTNQDDRDDIAFRLRRRADGSWCVYGYSILRSS